MRVSECDFLCVLCPLTHVAAEAASVLNDGGHPSYKKEWIVLAACGPTETLPTAHLFPADLFTSCLTTPIKTALRFAIQVMLSGLDAVNGASVILLMSCCRKSRWCSLTARWTLWISCRVIQRIGTALWVRVSRLSINTPIIPFRLAGLVADATHAHVCVYLCLCLLCDVCRGANLGVHHHC